MNDKEIKQIQEAQVSQMSKDEVFEIMRILNIIEGDKIKNEFTSYKRFGITVQKEGRVSYDVIVKEAPTLIDDIKNIEGAPGDVIEKVYPKLISGDVNFNEMSSEEQDKCKKILEETHTLEQKGVVFNENMLWELWKINRGEVCRKFVQDAGLPINQLIEMYSYFTDEQVQEIKEKYHKYF